MKTEALIVILSQPQFADREVWVQVQSNGPPGVQWMGPARLVGFDDDGDVIVSTA